MKNKLYNLAVVGILISAPLYPKDIVKCPDTLSVWMKHNLTYQKEQIDYWKSPEETVKDKGGDCIGENEMIWTNTGKKHAKDITYNDLILSYDFKNQQYEYKKIIKIWNKGVKPLYRIDFKNGTFINVTYNHKMIVKQNNKYIEKMVSELNYNQRDKIQVPTFKKLPYKIKDIKWLNEDLCFIIGHYIAEGYYDTKHVRTCGYDCTSKIIPLLKKNNIPYSVYYNKKKLPIITFLKSDFKNYIRNIKINSRTMQIPKEFLNLPPNKLQKFIDGILLGDGHYDNFDFKNKKFTRNKIFTISNSCFNTVKTIQEIGLKLGKPFYIWKQEHHGGLGKHPIWRISYNSNSRFAKNKGYKYLSDLGIKNITKITPDIVYDFMIEDNHNFVMENGVIVHNCEDFAILAQKILKDLSYEGDIILLSKFKGKENWKVGHMICLFKNKKGEYRVFDNQYLLKYKSKNKIETISHYYPDYDYIRVCTPDRYCGEKLNLR